MAVTIRYAVRFTMDEFDALLARILHKGVGLSEVREALLEFFPHSSLRDRVIAQHRAETAVPASVFLLKPTLKDQLVPDPEPQ